MAFGFVLIIASITTSITFGLSAMGMDDAAPTGPLAPLEIRGTPVSYSPGVLTVHACDGEVLFVYPYQHGKIIVTPCPEK